MLAANAAVELKVDHIPREHCRELENILSDWAKGLRQQAGRVIGKPQMLATQWPDRVDLMSLCCCLHRHMLITQSCCVAV